MAQSNIANPGLIVAVAVGLALYLQFPHPEDMFVRFPRVGKAFLPGQKVEVDVPYHNYDSNALLIHGWADPAAVSAMIANKAFHPVINENNGKALATFWVVDYKNTSVGPYKVREMRAPSLNRCVQEFVVVFTVSTTPGLTVDCTTIHCVNVVNTQPGIRQYIYKLWLDQDLPIEYGRLLLGCDKFKSKMSISVNDDSIWAFDFEDDSTLSLGSLFSGKLGLNPGILPGYIAHLPYLIWEMGLVKATFFVINPAEFTRWAATGPPGVATGLVPAVPIDASPLWGALFVTDPRFTWAADGDDLKLGEHWAGLKFEPVLYQHDTNLRAILLGAWGHAAQPK